MPAAGLRPMLALAPVSCLPSSRLSWPIPATVTESRVPGLGKNRALPCPPKCQGVIEGHHRQPHTSLGCTDARTSPGLFCETHHTTGPLILDSAAWHSPRAQEQRGALQVQALRSLGARPTRAHVPRADAWLHAMDLLALTKPMALEP